MPIKFLIKFSSCFSLNNRVFVWFWIVFIGILTYFLLKIFNIFDDVIKQNFYCKMQLKYFEILWKKKPEKFLCIVRLQLRPKIKWIFFASWTIYVFIPQNFFCLIFIFHLVLIKINWQNTLKIENNKEE